MISPDHYSLRECAPTFEIPEVGSFSNSGFDLKNCFEKNKRSAIISDIYCKMATATVACRQTSLPGATDTLCAWIPDPLDCDRSIEETFGEDRPKLTPHILVGAGER